MPDTAGAALRRAGGHPLAWLSLLLALAACRAAPLPADDAPARSALSAEEQAAGWQLLFDGTSLAGWRGFRRDDPSKGWEIRNGTIHFDGRWFSDDLITRERFADFELALEWRIAEGGNSGILYRVTEGRRNTWETGPEYQILDAAGVRPAPEPVHAAGANYDLDAPVSAAAKPAGEWNRARLVVSGAHVEHWLNGERVVTYELWSDAWKAQVSASKFGGMPDYGLAREGHIALQAHDSPVWFRSLRIRRLTR